MVSRKDFAALSVALSDRMAALEMAQAQLKATLNELKLQERDLKLLLEQKKAAAQERDMAGTQSAEATFHEQQHAIRRLAGHMLLLLRYLKLEVAQVPEHEEVRKASR